MIDTTLLNAMIKTCKEAPTDFILPKDATTITKETMNNISKNKTIVPEKKEVTINKVVTPRTSPKTIAKLSTSPKKNDKEESNITENIRQIEKDFLAPKDKPAGDKRIESMMQLSIAYEELFKKLTRQEKQQTIAELEKKQKQYAKTDYQYDYYASMIKLYKEKMNVEVK